MTNHTISDVWIGEEEVEYLGYKADVPDFTELDPADGRLFPNIPCEYRDTIKWLIDPQDERDKPPLYVLGRDPSNREKPEYGVGLTTAKMKVGQQFDLVSLLLQSRSRLLRVGSADDHYVEPQTLEGKYVLVVCVFAPIRWVDYACKSLCQLRIVSDQLSEAENFEMVIVPKMRKSCATSKPSFDKFLSAFNGCLFVPFKDDKVRDKVCQSLNFNGTLRVVLLDANHKVVQAGVSEIVANYYYPTGGNNTKLKQLDPDWIRTPVSSGGTIDRYRSSSLAWLLDTSYGDATLRLSSLSSSESITVEQLSDKLVGVYLFQKGDKLESLVKVYDECRKKGRHFEIVVVCVSLFSSLDPLVFRDVAICELKKVISGRPWWVLPYNAATYAALFDLNLGLSADTIITVGPRKKLFVDVHGGDVLHSYGIEAYPFHREMIVRRYELFAKSITLDSLLCYGGVDHVLRGDIQVTVAELRDKVVVLYTCDKLDYNIYNYKLLSQWYEEIREHHSDFEVVFVPYEEPEGNDNDEQVTDGMELLVRPYDPNYSEYLRNHKYIFRCRGGRGHPVEGLSPYSMLLFGKGGHLCSFNAVLRFEQYELDGYPYESGCGDNYLREDIIRSLGFEFSDFMSDYQSEKPYDVISLD